MTFWNVHDSTRDSEGHAWFPLTTAKSTIALTRGDYSKIAAGGNGVWHRHSAHGAEWAIADLVAIGHLDKQRTKELIVSQDNLRTQVQRLDNFSS